MVVQQPSASTRRIYLALSIVGGIIPYIAFGKWLITYGIDPQRFVSDLFTNGISTFFALDVVISAIVLLTLTRSNAQLTVPQRWGVILATVCVGGSCGLPLYLFFAAQHQQDARK